MHISVLLPKQCFQYSSLITYILIYLYITLFLSACGGEPPTSSLELANKGIYAAALPNLGSKAIISSSNHGASLWDIASEERIYNWNHTSENFTIMSDVSISNNQKVGLTAEKHQYALWNVESGKAIEFRSVPGEITAIVLSDTGAFALAGLKNYQCLFIDVFNNRTLHSLRHQGAIRSVALSEAPEPHTDRGPEGNLVGLTSADDKTVKLWNLNSGEAIYTWKFDNIVNHVNLSQKGAWSLLSIQHERWLLYQNSKKTDPQEHFSVSNRGMSITASAFSLDGSKLLFGGSSRVIELWDTLKKEKIASWRAPKKERWSPYPAGILEVGFSTSEGTIYAITSAGMLYRWALPEN